MSVLVRNLSRTEATQNVVRAAFAAHGDVEDVYLPQDYYTRQPRGFAFVEFAEFVERFVDGEEGFGPRDDAEDHNDR